MGISVEEVKPSSSEQVLRQCSSIAELSGLRSGTGNIPLLKVTSINLFIIEAADLPSVIKKKDNWQPLTVVQCPHSKSDTMNVITN